MQQGAFRESQPFIYLDGARVLGKDVQDRLLAAAEDAVHQRVDQNAGIAVTEMVGMRAHGTDLGVAGKLEALARHRCQRSADANAEVISHFVGARAKGAGIGQLGESQHFRNISFG